MKKTPAGSSTRAASEH